MSEQEKKRQIIYDLLKAETKPKFLCLLYTKQRHFFLTEKELFEEKKEWRIEKKKNKKKKTERRVVFNCSRYGDYEGPHNVNRKAH